MRQNDLTVGGVVPDDSRLLQSSLHLAMIQYLLKLGAERPVLNKGVSYFKIIKQKSILRISNKSLAERAGELNEDEDVACKLTLN